MVSGGLWVLSIPPFKFSEAAYIAFVPLLLWLFTKPPGRQAIVVGLGVGWLSWFFILIWLRHVTWWGTVLLSGLLGMFFAAWVCILRERLPHLEHQNLLSRILSYSGFAGFWVVLEWLRSWFLWGFPWAPYALSQWERPVILQIAAWTGAYGVSFLLIFFNLCIARTLREYFVGKKPKHWTGRFSPDLCVALAGQGFCIYVFFVSLPEKDSSRSLFTAGVVQPYILPELKWDPEQALDNLQILERQTRFVGTLENDLILWPEAAPPWPILGNEEMQVRVEALVNELGKPILMGALAWDAHSERWSNGIFLVEPGTGLSSAFYAKRELVPFGEYVPKFFSFINKIVPIGGSFAPGKDVGIIELKLGGRVIRVASLVCYEDVFPALARSGAAAGADLIFVATNNAWYGEEGGAEQHAAHSVLRAVENRRPVMRVGNGGWSGWIDSYGVVRNVLTDAEGRIYFRGGGNYELFEYLNWKSQPGYYTKHGDRFVAVSGVFAFYICILGCFRRSRKVYK